VSGGDDAALLGPGGAFVRQLPDFHPREAQQTMAQAVADTLAQRSRLLVEAGTGTGKTFGYLVPALRAACRVVVSTGTKTLQDQLFFRDLPQVRGVLGAKSRVALLKGRANYLCTYRLRRALGDVRRSDVAAVLHNVERWAATSERGELSEVGAAIDDPQILPRITSSADNCLGSRCPDFSSCFVLRARRAAQAADLTVVNHHLLLADFALKRSGFGEILPGADAVIIDEAHQLPELAAQFFGRRVSTGQLAELVRDAREEGRVLEDRQDLLAAGEALAMAAVSLEQTVEDVSGRIPTARAEAEVSGFLSASGALGEALAELHDVLHANANRSPGLESCAERAQTLLGQWRGVAVDPVAPPVAAADGDAEDRDEGDVRWIERLYRGVALHSTPIRVASSFRELMDGTAAAWVFTSATLCAGDAFASYKAQLGIDDAATLQLDSPFDYRRQARLYLPDGLPDPNAPDYPEAVAEQLTGLLRACGGGAFVLCTSHRAVTRIAARLRALPYPLLIQGDDDKATLLSRFAAAGNAVLVGTASFWEGVDVRGQALRMVAIDRLPFAAPGDPVQEARLAAIRRRGGSPFNEDQLPHAITLLRQGVGRLIRDRNDRGLLVLCDPRLTTRSYGRRILSTLPPVPRVDRDTALQWLRDIQVAA
jgi:ATP-dependent DNA helicase DinG